MDDLSLALHSPVNLFSFLNIAASAVSQFFRSLFFYKKSYFGEIVIFFCAWTLMDKFHGVIFTPSHQLVLL